MGLLHGETNLSQLKTGSGLFSSLANDIVTDSLAFLERAYAGSLDGGDMDEYILAAIARFNESIALLRVEPLHSSGRHISLFFG